jgi:hypothetical protein
MDAMLDLWTFEEGLSDFGFNNSESEFWQSFSHDTGRDSGLEENVLLNPSPAIGSIQETVLQSHEEAPHLLNSPQPRSRAAEDGRKSISAEAQLEMNEWITEHIRHPFLTTEEEDYFMAKYGITRRQVKTALNNRRQRIVTPIRLAAQRELQEQFLNQLTAIGIPLPRYATRHGRKLPR